MRKTIAAAIATLALAGVGADVALADTPGCVTRKEFRRVEKGMRMSRVHAIFDTAGKQAWYMSGSYGYPAEQGREYKPCPAYSHVEVDYKRKSGVWRVTGKLAYWG